MASVIGLAPLRPDLKGRLRELLCIHGPAFALSSFGAASSSSLSWLACRAVVQSEAPGEGWSPRLVSRQCLLLFRQALICLSYSGRISVSRLRARDERL